MKLKKMYGQPHWNSQFLFMSPLKLALQKAKAKENHGLTEFILENVDPKSSAQCFSPIHIAAYFGYTDVVINLIPKYDNPNAPWRPSNATPIHMAARNGQNSVAIHSGDTPIHFAAIGGHSEIVESLKQFTDNINAPNNNGDTPSKYAKENGHLNLSYFLETGSHPNLLKRICNSFRKISNSNWDFFCSILLYIIICSVATGSVWLLATGIQGVL